ncbi:MAG: succinate dehydrogenase flavoprotein subunit [Bacillota bacterium]|nr:succinate dehydrogenase flavoprotein subunit [Bacillota bacterium]
MAEVGKEPRVIVVGGGLAGLMATIKACEAGMAVDLFSIVPCKRSHSACAQGGINAAVNTKGEGDTPWEHFDDTIYGGDFLANQTPVKGMCEAAPKIINLFDRMGMMFNRTDEGLIMVRRLGGVKHSRTVFAGATTGQQLLYALDEQVRRWEAKGLVVRREGWEFLSAIVDDDGVCQGIVAQEHKSMEIHSFTAKAVVIATGGPGMIFGKTTNSTINNGGAAARLYLQGVKYANGEFIQIHPTAIPGADKNRLMSESARGEGARVWTYKDGKPWYFLEEMYPAYGNLVPRDIATRAIFEVCVSMGLGVDGKNMVYLDLSHKDPRELDRKLGGILEIYEKFIGDDPRKIPMKIFPAVHYSMGGLWVDFEQMTNITGLFAAGECEYQYHGANRLGGNGMLSAIYGGMVAGESIVKYVQGKSALEASPRCITEAIEREEEQLERIMAMDGTENAYQIHRELGQWMTDNVTVVRYNDRLAATDNKLQELMERFEKVNINNTNKWNNQAVFFLRNLEGMLEMARVITLGALARDESRGAHYKPEFAQRDDENWLKTTIAEHSPEGPQLSYEQVDLSYIKPRERKYDVDKEVTMGAKSAG